LSPCGDVWIFVSASASGSSLSAMRLRSLSRSSSGSYSVWSRRLRATTTPVAAVTPATPARPTIFQGTLMGA
jgi:hypothetical protein